MPTQHGESAVIRILPKDRGLLVVEKLGFSSADDATLRRLLKMPHGMIVITGPTGSGKTTTLATILSILNEPVRKILTIEDPVEYEIPGVNQSQIKPAIGLTFAAALRSFVRQDPDVIMVGEVRDSETAHVAVHAALTGHLVLTTLHTETAAAAVPRLLDLGVEGYLLRSVLRAVIAQRLVRQLCERCKSPKTLTEADLAEDPAARRVRFPRRRDAAAAVRLRALRRPRLSRPARRLRDSRTVQRSSRTDRREDRRAEDRRDGDPRRDDDDARRRHREMPRRIDLARGDSPRHNRAVSRAEFSLSGPDAKRRDRARHAVGADACGSRAPDRISPAAADRDHRGQASDRELRRLWPVRPAECGRGNDLHPGSGAAPEGGRTSRRRARIACQRCRCRPVASGGRQAARGAAQRRKSGGCGRGSSGAVSPDVRRAGSRRRSLGHARPGARPAGNGTGAIRTDAPQAHGCDAVSDLRADRSRLRHAVLYSVRAAAIFIGAAGLRRQVGHGARASLSGCRTSCGPTRPQRCSPRPRRWPASGGCCAGPAPARWS